MLSAVKLFGALIFFMLSIFFSRASVLLRSESAKEERVYMGRVRARRGTSEKSLDREGAPRYINCVKKQSEIGSLSIFFSN